MRDVSICSTSGVTADRLVDLVTADLRCSWCEALLDNPLRAPCGRTFCAGCILPLVLQLGICPAQSCCSNLSAADLDNDLQTRQRILALQTRCQFHLQGCDVVLSLDAMQLHVRDCPHRPVACRNRGCKEVVSELQLARHEAEACPHRPVGICNQGCGLVVAHFERDSHVCLEALRAQLAEQELCASGLREDLRRSAVAHRRRERALMAQLAALHVELQTNALKFKKVAAEFQAQAAYLAKKLREQQVQRAY